MPYYENIFPYRSPKVWQNPDRGMLAGKVVETLSDGNFSIQDLAGHIWKIICDKCFRKGNFDIQNGTMIKMIGKEDGVDVFQAVEFRPFELIAVGRNMELIPIFASRICL